MNPNKFSSSVFYDTVNSFYKTSAVRTALELDIFSIIGEDGKTIKQIAESCQASERGVRILCNYLVSIDFMCIEGNRFFLNREMSLHLNRKSPYYLGGTTKFLLSEYIIDSFKHLTEVIRTGELPIENEGIVAPNQPQWVEFARAMEPMMLLPSLLLADIADYQSNKPINVLDLAAGHGQFGIAMAQRNPNTHVTFLDWKDVLGVARENAQKAGVEERTSYIPGNAFTVDFGKNYDIILMTNFLHHFDKNDCVTIMKKAYNALNDNGRVLIFEIIDGKEKQAQKLAATFSMLMLATTPNGEVYNEKELKNISFEAGFVQAELHEIPPAVEKVIVAYKNDKIKDITK
ncbi:class I SAM-dependent methyltransferase [Xenorhabdus sp. SGI246]|uniref:class I SAM-dependent methyltransferase n=1 Tax=Xenorhabdus sp. SGI246 TaxID=3158263 RepID=UPI00349F6640